MFHRTLIIGAALAVATSARAQSIQERVDAVTDGFVRMSFASREGVCGDGHGGISTNFGGRGYHESRRMVIHGDAGWWDDCEEGPVRVSLRMRNGEIADVRTDVGGEWRSTTRPVTDLGEVDASLAVEFFLGVVRSADRKRVAEEAVLPAVIARDVIVWPELLEIARERDVDADVRRSCVFWLGQMAGDRATEGLAELVDDDDLELEVRRAAVFSLSQQDSEMSVRRLIEVARGHRIPQLRREALFWLAQADDPRALDLFEEILTAR